MRCPRCGSATAVYKKIGEVRYRKCRRCRLNVVTVEVERYVWDTVVDAARAAGLDVDRLNRIIREGVIVDA
jgi:hypothetical protein